METQVIVKASKKEIENLFNDANLPYMIKYYEVNKDTNDITVLIRHAENTRVRKKKFDNIKDMDKAFRSSQNKKEPKSLILGSIYITGQNITYPLYGNKHVTPYGTLVIDGEIGKKVCRIQEDNNYYNYITYNRKRYYVTNIGHYMAANFVLDKHKTKDYYYERGYQEVII